MQALLWKVKQGFETYEERLSMKNLTEVVSFRTRMRPVIAMRLHVQQSSFWLCTSSNMPFILTNDAHGSSANSNEECSFHLAASVLRSA
jgi:hypothetical protein